MGLAPHPDPCLPEASPPRAYGGLFPSAPGPELPARDMVGTGMWGCLVKSLALCSRPSFNRISLLPVSRGLLLIPQGTTQARITLGCWLDTSSVNHMG